MVADYLARVRDAGASLSPSRRDELVEDLREHIATARAELVHETESDVRTLLHRLGDPAAIVAEAAAGEPPPPQVVAAMPQPAVPPTSMPPPGMPPPKRDNRVLVTVLTILAIVVGLPVLVCAAGILFFRTNAIDSPGGPSAPVEVSHIPASRS